MKKNEKPEPKPVTLECEAEVGDPTSDARMKMKQPMLCRKQAGWYRMSGELTSVVTRLCGFHVKMFTDRGLRLVSINAPKEVTDAAAHDESGSGPAAEPLV